MHISPVSLSGFSAAVSSTAVLAVGERVHPAHYEHSRNTAQTAMSTANKQESNSNCRDEQLQARERERASAMNNNSQDLQATTTTATSLLPHTPYTWNKSPVTKLSRASPPPPPSQAQASFEFPSARIQVIPVLAHPPPLLLPPLLSLPQPSHPIFQCPSPLPFRSARKQFVSHSVMPTQQRPTLIWLGILGGKCVMATTKRYGGGCVGRHATHASL